MSGVAGTPPPHNTSLFSSFSSIGLGFSVVIALFSLLLLASLVAASCYCYRSYSRARSRRTSSLSNLPPNTNSDETGVVLPRIVFVTDDDDDVVGGGGGSQSPVGLDPAAISSYPKFPYSKSNSNSGGDTACPICLCAYKEGEMLRMLPDCRHRFHLLCVDAWLRLNASCPVCRTSPMPTPISTPLSELVPLSRFPAGQRRR